MIDYSEYRYHLNRLLTLLEEDAYEIERSFQGELLEKYRRIVVQEQDKLKEEIRKTFY